YRLLTSQRQANSVATVPTGYPIPKGAPLFAETFINNSKQWDMQSMQGRYVVSIKKGNLILEDDDNKLFPILLPGGKHFDNYKKISAQFSLLKAVKQQAVSSLHSLW